MTTAFDIAERFTGIQEVGGAVDNPQIMAIALKIAGATVFNAATSKPVWAAGSADGDVWVDATGATAHTPI